MAAHSTKPAFDFMGHLCGNGSLRRLGLRVLLDLAGYRHVETCLNLGGLLGGAACPLGPAQQPDEANVITRTLFVGLAMVESTAIYCLVISIILIFSNPFWNYVIR